jgi:hypothetical protein
MGLRGGRLLGENKVSGKKRRCFCASELEFSVTLTTVMLGVAIMLLISTVSMDRRRTAFMFYPAFSHTTSPKALFYSRPNKNLLDANITTLKPLALLEI